ncbi:SIMPL domain-containing protein [Sphingomonas agri]|uniref:SIMPL domain-containing protein n=1 Tax=Sphingomonas agri TaxID=1813878 RepID=UPI0031200410
MRSALVAALALGAVAIPSAAAAQQAGITQSISGTRLDVTATGEVMRVPDVAVISAGVVARSATAAGAIQDTANRMNQVLGALKRAGVDEKDIQTSNVSLNPEYRYPENQAPQLVGYTATNNVTVRFRDIRASGKILDALVAQGANQINGPTLVVDKPQAALDEARVKAIAAARGRAELYARSLGLRIVRVVAISEQSEYPSQPMPVLMGARMASAETKIEPGQQKLQVSVAMTFELQ